MSDDGTTHAEGCHAWGPRHHACALHEIERLRRAIARATCTCGVADGDVTPAAHDAVDCGYRTAIGAMEVDRG